MGRAGCSDGMGVSVGVDIDVDVGFPYGGYGSVVFS